MNKKSTKRDLQAMATKRKLLQKSMELITKHGYNGVTISDICNACNVSIGTFYLYFKSKSDIIAYLNRLHNEKLKGMCEVDETKSAIDMYCEYVDGYMRYVNQTGYTLSKSLMKSMIEAGSDQESSGLYLQKEFLFRVLDIGREKGEFCKDGIDNESFFDLFIVIINGILTTWFIVGEDFDIVYFGVKQAMELIKILKVPRDA